MMRGAVPISARMTAAVAALLFAGPASAELVSVRGAESVAAPQSARASTEMQSGALGGWSFEFVQSAWTPSPSFGAARAAVTELRVPGWSQFAAGGADAVYGSPAFGLAAYDLDGAAWWNRSAGAFLSARVVDDASIAGMQAVLADVGAAWRVVEWRARTVSPVDRTGSLDLVAGARVAATSAGEASVGSAVSAWTDFDSEAAPMVGFRSRAALSRGVDLTLRGDVSPRLDGAGVAWRVGGGVRVDLGDSWDMSVEAGWRTLDAALMRGIGDDLSGGLGDGGGRVGAVWVGFSKAF